MLLVFKFLGKSKGEPNKPCVWKSHCKWLRWDFKLCGVETQGITRVGKTLIARLMETQI